MSQNPYNDRMFGNFMTRTFTEAYGDSDTAFLTNLQATPLYAAIIAQGMTDTQLKTMYWILYARYGNSHLINMDETQSRYQFYTKIFQYAPAWQRELDVQKSIRQMSESDIMAGSRTIVNHAYNPSSAPSTASQTELSTIDDQNTQRYYKAKIDAYGQLIALIKKDVTQEFLDRFKDLFLRIVEPYAPLWYETVEEDDDGNG